MKPYRIRRATIEDIPELTRQRHAMFTDMRHQPPRALAMHDRAFPGWAKREMRAGRMVCFLVENSERKVAAGGALWLRDVQPYPGFRGGKVPYLMSMYTDPAHRGKGIATMLVRHAIAWSVAHGFDSVTLHASKMGRPLYEKFGWKSTSEMELDLPKERRGRPGSARQRSRRSGR